MSNGTQPLTAGLAQRFNPTVVPVDDTAATPGGSQEQTSSICSQLSGPLYCAQGRRGRPDHPRRPAEPFAAVGARRV